MYFFTILSSGFHLKRKAFSIHQHFELNIFFLIVLFRKLVVGDPKDDNTFTGPLISKEHLAKVKGYVALAEKEGATIISGKEELKLPEKLSQVSKEYFSMLDKDR